MLHENAILQFFESDENYLGMLCATIQGIAEFQIAAATSSIVKFPKLKNHFPNQSARCACVGGR